MDVGIASKSREFQTIPALLDSRANTTFIDKAVTEWLGLPLEALTSPIRVFNVDGSHNSAGDITHAVNLTVDFLGHREELRAKVTNLGKNSLILSYTWLKKHNPSIDWEKGTVKFHRCPHSCLMLQDRAQRLASLDEEDEREALEWIHQAKVEAPAKKPVRTPEELVPPCYHSYLDIFLEKAASRFPLRKPWDHAINLKDSFKLKKGRLIPLSPEEQKEVSEFVNEQLAKGYIRPSKSEQTSPVFFVPKKDGRKRMVQDYRYLNEHTVRNNYPLPLISQLVDKLKGLQYFMKIDLRWGYNNVRIKEGDEWKAAFICHRGSYEPTVMFFGLCNSPATFQTMMNEIFTDMEDVVVVYIDDIMIFTKGSLAEHQAKVKEVLQRLHDNDLFAHPEKCSFDKTEVEYLGMFVNQDSIHMDDSKVKAITHWPAPTTVRSVRSFLGLANFYCRFIKDYATLAKPLTDLMQKDKAFTWGSVEANTFASLKTRFTTAPILAYPDNDCQFRLETDASDFATGAVLSIQKNDKWHPVAFSSHAMSPEERNYPVADKEMLSVIRALEQWCHYLEGAKHQFDIWNDHANLQWFMKRQDLNRRQARWAQYLSHFSFLWSHKAGSTMGKADALSRREDHAVSVADDNKGVTVISPSQVRSLPIIEDIKKKIFDALVTRTETEVYHLCKEKGICEEHDGFLYDSSGRMYVPDDDPLHMHIISSHHDSPVARHPGYQKTQELIERQYYWPGLALDVCSYVARCDCCACFKGSNTKPAGSAVLLQPSTMPWVDVSADFITDLPLSNGFDSILTVVD